MGFFEIHVHEYGLAPVLIPNTPHTLSYESLFLFLRQRHAVPTRVWQVLGLLPSRHLGWHVTGMIMAWGSRG